MHKTRQIPLTSQQYARLSALCLIGFLIGFGLMLGDGDLREALAMLCIFFLGAMCASYGAKSRERKIREGLTVGDAMAYVADFKQRQREKQK